MKRGPGPSSSKACAMVSKAAFSTEGNGGLTHQPRQAFSSWGAAVVASRPIRNSVRAPAKSGRGAAMETNGSAANPSVTCQGATHSTAPLRRRSGIHASLTRLSDETSAANVTPQKVARTMIPHIVHKAQE